LSALLHCFDMHRFELESNSLQGISPERNNQ